MRETLEQDPSQTRGQMKNPCRLEGQCAGRGSMFAVAAASSSRRSGVSNAAVDAQQLQPLIGYAPAASTHSVHRDSAKPRVGTGHRDRRRIGDDD